MAETWTVLKILQWTADYFTEKGIDSPRLDAELLLSATLGLDRVGLYVNFEQPLNSRELTDYREKVRRRSAREPVQYILGGTEFWSLPFEVNPSVLIPRPDTEVLVEEALKKLPEDAHLIDVGTGSGAIAVALSHERSDLHIMAIDCSAEALEVARLNAERNRVGERMALEIGDLQTLPDGPFDMIVSNPPYIPTRDWEELMPEVHDHEPRLALDGGADGLDAYRQLAIQSGHVLVPGGWLIVEVGIRQAGDVAAIFQSAGLTNTETRDDYAGIPRVVMGQNKL